MNKELGQLLTLAFAVAATVCPFSSAAPQSKAFLANPFTRAAATPGFYLRTNGFVALADTLDVIPPDSNGAVSENFIVTALNSQVRIQRKNGEQIRTLSLSAFWSPAGAQTPFDPRTLYDAQHKRWLMTAVSDRGTGTSSLLLAISASDDPSGEWRMHKILGGTTAGAFMDFPVIGFNRHSVAISCLVRSNVGNHVVDSRVYLFQKDQLYSTGSAEFLLQRYRADSLPIPVLAPEETGQLLFLAAPIRTNGPVAEIHLLTLDLSPAAQEMQVLGIFSNLPPWAAVAPNNGNLARQLGSSQRVHMQDSVIQNVVQKGSRLWFSQMVFLPPDTPNRASVQWGELTLNAINFIERIDDPSGSASYTYPSLAVNAADQICIGFSKFSPTHYPSAACALILDTKRPANIVEIMLKEGEGPYFRTSGTGKNRWGDYSSTHVDPLDNFTFWTIQQYAGLSAGDPEIDGSGRWSTWWSRIAFPGARFTGISQQSSLSLHLLAAPGFTYLLQATSSLDSGWSAIREFSGAGTMTLTNLPRTEPQQFYRVTSPGETSN